MKILLTALLLLSIPKLNASVVPASERILEVVVDSEGLITAAGDTITLDKLAHYIQQRLFKAWLSNGKMYTQIRFTKKGEVSETVSDPVLKEIKSGQEQGLTAICLEKYRTRFENLDPGKQASIKKKLPVLFQTEY